MFRNKLRPAGLEAPACDACNSATRMDEQVVALMTRTFPDPPSEEASAEIGKIVKAVENNRPGLLVELAPRVDLHGEEMRLARKIGQEVHLINVSGPLLNVSMQMFGRKVGLAFHYLIIRDTHPLFC
jgi:hypothetical protein